MSLKTEIIKRLETCEDGYTSGAALAKELSVSRTAVWKTIESLRIEGFDISASTNRGYRLQSGGDVLLQSAIEGFIKTSGVFRVEVRKSVSSTNTALREIAGMGTQEGYVLVAEEQTDGKGRFGRKFHSPHGHGVYFSLLLRPNKNKTDATLITSAAAVAAAQAIEQVFGIKAGIKWVNDLFIGDKKICGILTEADYDMESGSISNAVLGIGINVTKPEEGFPDALAEIACSLTDRVSGKDSERCRLIAATLDRFWDFYIDLSARKFLDEYRERSIVLGQDVYVISGDNRKPAHALELDDDCRLIVRYENNDIAALASGEVSVKV